MIKAFYIPRVKQGEDNYARLYIEETADQTGVFLRCGNDPAYRLTRGQAAELCQLIDPEKWRSIYDTADCVRWCFEPLDGPLDNYLMETCDESI